MRKFSPIIFECRETAGPKIAGDGLKPTLTL